MISNVKQKPFQKCCSLICTDNLVSSSIYTIWLTACSFDFDNTCPFPHPFLVTYKARYITIQNHWLLFISQYRITDFSTVFLGLKTNFLTRVWTLFAEARLIPLVSDYHFTTCIELLQIVLGLASNMYPAAFRTDFHLLIR